MAMPGSQCRTRTRLNAPRTNSHALAIHEMNPILFLDFDDVICLNEPYGGYDALSAFAEATRNQTSIQTDAPLWSGLFDAQASEHLKQVHEEFSPNYVLSTSWRWFFDRDALVQTLDLGGLSFVAEHLHMNWSTPQLSRQAHRAVEIKGWLAEHPECTSWVVLDDELSGTGFSSWSREPRKFVVLCQAGVGLQKAEFEQLKQALSVCRLLSK